MNNGGLIKEVIMRLKRFKIDNEWHCWFHNYAYRHLLRSPSSYQQWKNLKHCPNTKWWDKKYREIYNTFKQKRLDPSDFSFQHTKIIDTLLRLKGTALKAYHKKPNV